MIVLFNTVSPARLPQLVHSDSDEAQDLELQVNFGGRNVGCGGTRFCGRNCGWLRQKCRLRVASSFGPDRGAPRARARENSCEIAATPDRDGPHGRAHPLGPVRAASDQDYRATGPASRTVTARTGSPPSPPVSPNAHEGARLVRAPTGSLKGRHLELDPRVVIVSWSAETSAP